MSSESEKVKRLMREGWNAYMIKKGQSCWERDKFNKTRFSEEVGSQQESLFKGVLWLLVALNEAVRPCWTAIWTDWLVLPCWTAIWTDWPEYEPRHIEIIKACLEKIITSFDESDKDLLYLADQILEECLKGYWAKIDTKKILDLDATTRGEILDARGRIYNKLEKFAEAAIRFNPDNYEILPIRRSKLRLYEAEAWYNAHNWDKGSKALTCYVESNSSVSDVLALYNRALMKFCKLSLEYGKFATNGEIELKREFISNTWTKILNTYLEKKLNTPYRNTLQKYNEIMILFQDSDDSWDSIELLGQAEDVNSTQKWGRENKWEYETLVNKYQAEDFS